MPDVVDALSVFTGGWFQDGPLDDPVLSTFTDGWFNGFPLAPAFTGQGGGGATVRAVPVSVPDAVLEELLLRAALEEEDAIVALWAAIFDD